MMSQKQKSWADLVEEEERERERGDSIEKEGEEFMEMENGISINDNNVVQTCVSLFNNSKVQENSGHDLQTQTQTQTQTIVAKNHRSDSHKGLLNGLKESNL